MKDFPTKVNLSGGDDPGTALDFGAKEFNSLSKENENAVTSTGQTLTTGQGDDTATDQLARAIVIAGQSASSYTDSGAADAYVLTSTLATLVQPEAYYNGMRVSFIPGNANTGTSTINVSALGVKAIRTVADVNIVANDLITTKAYDLVYDSTFNSSAGAFVLDDSVARNTQGVSENASNIGWGAWQAPSYNAGWADYTVSGLPGLRYRRSNDGHSLWLYGASTATGTPGTQVFTLPSGYRPTQGRTYTHAYTFDIAEVRNGTVETTGVVTVVNYDAATTFYNFNVIVPLT